MAAVRIGMLRSDGRTRSATEAMRGDMSGEASDADLLEGVAGDDRAAFRQLHARYHGPVHGFAMRIVDAPDRAEEVANDTMLAIWRGAERFEGRSKVSTWIFGIAYRTAIRTLRRKGVERREVGADAAAEIADESTPTPDAALHHAEVRAALAELPGELRTVVRLTYYEGHSVTEVAELTGVSPGTVKSRMHRARRRLKERLG